MNPVLHWSERDQVFSRIWMIPRDVMRRFSVHRAFITNPLHLAKGAEPHAPVFVVGGAMEKREEVLND
jgi:hypothetical protein